MIRSIPFNTILYSSSCTFLISTISHKVPFLKTSVNFGSSLLGSFCEKTKIWLFVALAAKIALIDFSLPTINFFFVLGNITIPLVIRTGLFIIPPWMKTNSLFSTLYYRVLIFWKNLTDTFKFVMTEIFVFCIYKTHIYFYNITV